MYYVDKCFTVQWSFTEWSNTKFSFLLKLIGVYENYVSGAAVILELYFLLNIFAIH